MTYPTNLTVAVDGVTEIVAAHLNNLEAKVGIDASAVVTSLDYLVKNAASVDPGHGHPQSKITGLTIADSPVFATVKLSGLTDGYVPYHVADATGLANSPIFTNGTNVGIGTSAPTSILFVLGATVDNYGPPSLTHGSASVVELAGLNTGTALAITTDNASPFAWSMQVRNRLTDGSSYPLLLNPLGGNVGIQFTAPLSALCTPSLHVGGESDAGDNNLLVDGTCEITGATTLTGLVKTAGGLHVGGTSDPGADNLLVDGTVEITGAATLTGLVKTVGGVHIGGISDPGADNLLVDGTTQITGAFGCNTKTPQTPYASGGEVPPGGTGTAEGGWDTAAHRNSAIQFMVNVRAALIANGIMS